MEIRTCEEYVLSKLAELELEVCSLKAQLNEKDNQIRGLEDTVTTYDELFREHGSQDVFDSNTHVNVDVSEAYKGEKEYYEFLMNRNGQFLKVNDYRKKTDENSQEDEE